MCILWLQQVLAFVGQWHSNVCQSIFLCVSADRSCHIMLYHLNSVNCLWSHFLGRYISTNGKSLRLWFPSPSSSYTMLCQHLHLWCFTMHAAVSVTLLNLSLIESGWIYSACYSRVWLQSSVCKWVSVCAWEKHVITSLVLISHH